MYLLRRAAVRATSQQTSRSLNLLREKSTQNSVLQFAKPVLFRSFHQSPRWLAEEWEKTSAATEQEQSVTERAQEAVGSATETVKSAADTVSQAAGFAAPRSPGSKTTVFVGNLFFEVTAPQLEAEFARCGKVVSSRIVTDPRGLSRGYGFVEFENPEDASRAIQELDQKVFEGRRMAVQSHIGRERRPTMGSSPVQNREPNPPSETLFVGNMSYQMSDRDLNDLFRDIRDVVNVRVAIDRRTGQPRGFAHADFVDVDAARKAKEFLETKVIYGRPLRVDFSMSSANRTRGPLSDGGVRDDNTSGDV